MLGSKRCAHFKRNAQAVLLCVRKEVYKKNLGRFRNKNKCFSCYQQWRKKSMRRTMFLVLAVALVAFMMAPTAVSAATDTGSNLLDLTLGPALVSAGWNQSTLIPSAPPPVVATAAPAAIQAQSLATITSATTLYSISAETRHASDGSWAFPSPAAMMAHPLLCLKSRFPISTAQPL